MADVTKANFQKTRPVVEALIQRCTFISESPKDAHMAAFTVTMAMIEASTAEY